MWSNNKIINITINVLLFCVGINIFHYGQLLLPVICLILFIENGFRFRVNDYKTFIVLCLFAISFFAFSYQLGFYCVMGFCLPMAYYIGSNLKKTSEENVRKVIYIIAFGMAMHMILNFFLELYFWHGRLSYLFNKISHYDIWLFNTDPNTIEQYEGNVIFPNVQFIRVRTTATSMNYIMLSSVIYYLVKYEKNRVFKYIGLVLFTVSSVYCLALGRRTTLFILLISVLTALLMEIKNRNANFNLRFLIKAVSIIGFLTILLIVFITFNVFGIKDILMNLSIVNKLIRQGFKTERFEILLKSISLAPKYPFGGQKISAETGSVIHDLWGDIYDYAGIVPYILMLIYSAGVFKVFMKIQKNKIINNNQKLLYIVWFISSSLIMFIEPVFTGASIYLICYVIIASLVEKHLKQSDSLDSENNVV